MTTRDNSKPESLYWVYFIICSLSKDPEDQSSCKINVESKPIRAYLTEEDVEFINDKLDDDDSINCSWFYEKNTPGMMTLQLVYSILIDDNKYTFIPGDGDDDLYVSYSNKVGITRIKKC